MRLDDVFLRGVPTDGAALPVAFHRHAARNGHAVAGIEGAVRLLAGAGAFEKIGHVRARRRFGLSHHLRAIPAVYLLRQVTNLLCPGNGAVRSEHVLGAAELIVAEARIPAKQNLLGMFHRDIHGVGHFTAVLPKKYSASHCHRRGNLKAQHLVPECELVAHILVDITARIIPVETPVGVPVRVELALWRFAEKRIPDNVLGRHIRVERAGPLRFAVRRVPVHVRVDGGNLSHRRGIGEAHGVGDLSGRAGLVANLYSQSARLAVGRAHRLRVIDGERHRLFLVNVFAGVQ